MMNEAKNLSIVFIDVVESSKLYAEKGDSLAQKMISKAMSEIREITQQFSGQLIKEMGDGALVIFENPNSAAKASLLIQKNIKNLHEDEGEEWESLRVKIGLHYGSVLYKGEDVFGNEVNKAARIQDQAKAQQVLVSQEFLEHLSEELIDSSRFIIETPLKGLDGDHKIHELMNPEDNADSTMFNAEEFTDSFFQENSGQSMKFTFDGIDMMFVPEMGKIHLGREAENDIAIHGNGVSRQHAAVEYKKGRFVLRDMSINGTFLRGDDGVWKKLHREEANLPPQGAIALGSQQEDDSPYIIFFEIEK